MGQAAQKLKKRPGGSQGNPQRAKWKRGDFRAEVRSQALATTTHGLEEGNGTFVVTPNIRILEAHQCSGQVFWTDEDQSKAAAGHQCAQVLW